MTVAARRRDSCVRDAKRIVDALLRQGRLVKVGEDLYYPRSAGRSHRPAGDGDGDGGSADLAEARICLAPPAGMRRRSWNTWILKVDPPGREARRLRRRRR